MSALGVGMMVVICSLVWGGFTAFLIRAVRSEGRKGSQ
jgi:hypothetical protein